MYAIRSYYVMSSILNDIFAIFEGRDNAGMFHRDNLFPVIGFCWFLGNTGAGNEMADTRHKRTTPVNRKIFWPFFIIIIYTALAVPLACDIWQGSLGTNIDIHGRITLSILVLCVICPLFSSGSVFAIFYIKNGMGRRSLPELFFPPDSMPVTRMVGSESRKSMRLQTLV